MRAILDAGAFLAVERGDRRVRALLQVLRENEIDLVTSSAVVAQVWRDGLTQARIARLLGAVAVRGLAPDEDRRTGELLALTRTGDVIDAHLALCATHGDQILTSDRAAVARLLAARAIKATIVDV